MPWSSSRCLIRRLKLHRSYQPRRISIHPHFVAVPAPATANEGIISLAADIPERHFPRRKRHRLANMSANCRIILKIISTLHGF